MVLSGALWDTVVKHNISFDVGHEASPGAQRAAENPTTEDPTTVEGQADLEGGSSGNPGQGERCVGLVYCGFVGLKYIVGGD